MGQGGSYSEENLCKIFPCGIRKKHFICIPNTGGIFAVLKFLEFYENFPISKKRYPKKAWAGIVKSST